MAGHRLGQRHRRPGRPGRHRRLGVLSVQRPQAELLETPDVEARLRLLIEWTKDFLAESEVSDKIETDVRESVEKRNREYLLREQLKAIRKELGEGEADGNDDYRARVEAADLPDAVREAALREVGKLERAGDQNPEAGWIRTWLDTVLDLPWASAPRTPPTWPRPGRCSTPTTTGWTRSRSASSSTSASAPGASPAACRSSAAVGPAR